MSCWEPQVQDLLALLPWVVGPSLSPFSFLSSCYLMALWSLKMNCFYPSAFSLLAFGVGRVPGALDPPLLYLVLSQGSHAPYSQPFTHRHKVQLRVNAVSPVW